MVMHTLSPIYRQMIALSDYDPRSLIIPNNLLAEIYFSILVPMLMDQNVNV